MNYQSQVAKEVRAEREAYLKTKRLGMVTFKDNALGTKKLYCYQDIRSAPFTVTDGTTALCIDCDTIEHARIEFRRAMDKWLASGWLKIT
jgi:hypothetical protein